jgi:hypothetical protein
LSVINLEARTAYFRALEELWPEVLETLLRDVMPLYEPRWDTSGTQQIPILDLWEHLQQDGERKELVDSIKRWAAHFRITEGWFYNSALETLIVYCPKPVPPGTPVRETILRRHWHGTSSPSHPIFKPEFRDTVWYPPQRGWTEPWDVFKKRIESQLSSYLATYRRTVELKYGVGREENLLRDATWTVRYQKGETAIDIAETDNPGGLDPEQIVFRAVSRFAKSIGLNLRRRGQRVKPITVQPRV